MIHRRAFTLIELLVVISIIALLIAILFPTLSSAREAARDTQCLVNTKSLAQASINFTVENNGNLPWAYRAASPTDSAMLAMGQYMEVGVENWLDCPNAKQVDESIPRNGGNFGFWGSSDSAWLIRSTRPGNPFDVDSQGGYGMNQWNQGPGSNGKWFTNSTVSKRHKTISQVRDPSNTPMWSDASWQNVRPTNDEESLQDDYATFKGNRSTTSMLSVTLDRHNDGINISFLDGSSRTVRVRSLWSLKWHREWRERDDPDDPLPTTP